jgi:hypothetical protein
MDLTQTLSTLLVQTHSSKPISPSTVQLTQTLDAFLKEAYQIVRSLLSALLPLK